MTSPAFLAIDLVLASWLAVDVPDALAGAGRVDRHVDRAVDVAPASVPDSTRWADPCGTASGRYVTATRDPDGRPTFRVVDGGHCLEVRATGPVDLGADGEVRRVPAGGALLVQEARDGRTRRMAVTERAGRLDRTYVVDGAPRPAAEGADWLRAALRRVTDAGLGTETLRRPGNR
jgi:hypothetical protein